VDDETGRFMSRRHLRLALVISVSTIAATLATDGLDATRQESVKEVLAQSRAVIGVARHPITSIHLSGYRRFGFNGVTAELLPEQPYEVKILFPDHFVEVETTPFYDAVVGFAGAIPIQTYMPRNGAQLRAPSSSAGRGEQKLRISRLMLGMLVRSDGPVPQSSQRILRRDDQFTVRFKGQDGSEADLDIDATTSLPIQLRYDSLERFPRPISQEQRSAGIVPSPGPAERVEVEVQFSRRRLFDGISIPLLIRRTARGVVFEEIRVESVVINPRLSKEEFLALKK